MRYIFSQEYEWLLPVDIKKKTTFVGNSSNISSMLRDSLSLKNKKMIKKLFVEDTPTHIYLHNYHFLNHFIANLAKNNNCVFIYHLHEPFIQNKKAHGGFQQYWLHLFEYFSGRLLNNTSVLVVSSLEALRLLNLRYPKYSGRKTLIPLMYEDLGSSRPELSERQYITFVGPPVPAKNVNKFFDMVRYSNANNLGLKFLLISRSPFKASNLPKENLEIFYKERLTDEEFGRLINKSKVVITPYKRETQSSVILVSYMYGTPVVSSNIGGLPEFVLHKKTGYLLSLDSVTEDWINGINYVQKNLNVLSRNCREYFVENNSEKNWDKYLDSLLS